MQNKISKKAKFITLFVITMFVFSFSVPGVVTAEESDLGTPGLVVGIPESPSLSADMIQEDTKATNDCTSASSELNPEGLTDSELMPEIMNVEEPDNESDQRQLAEDTITDNGKKEDKNNNDDIYEGSSSINTPSANGIEPIVLEEKINQNPCGEPGHVWLKDDTPNKGADDGTYDGKDLSYQWDQNCLYLSWANTSLEWYVHALYVKGGTVNNVYYYTPEMQNDSDLHAPLNPKSGKYYATSLFAWFH